MNHFTTITSTSSSPLTPQIMVSPKPQRSSVATTATIATETSISAASIVLRAAERIGFDNPVEVLDKLQDEQVFESWQLEYLDSYQWQSLDVPMGLVSSIRLCLDDHRSRVVPATQVKSQGEPQEENPFPSVICARNDNHNNGRRSGSYRPGLSDEPDDSPLSMMSPGCKSLPCVSNKSYVTSYPAFATPKSAMVVGSTSGCKTATRLELLRDELQQGNQTLLSTTILAPSNMTEQGEDDDDDERSLSDIRSITVISPCPPLTSNNNSVSSKLGLSNSTLQNSISTLRPPSMPIRQKSTGYFDDDDLNSDVDLYHEEEEGLRQSQQHQHPFDASFNTEVSSPPLRPTRIQSLEPSISPMDDSFHYTNKD